MVYRGPSDGYDVPKGGFDADGPESDRRRGEEGAAVIWRLGAVRVAEWEEI